MGPGGQEAVALLTGAAPGARPGVVLLAAERPGLDGLSVLGRLADDGVLGRTEVIMLTARPAEIAAIAVLDLPAVGHVVKPVSLPALMQRVRRALG